MRRFVRAALAASFLFALPAAVVLVPSDARASVSIAVTFDDLVKYSRAVAVVTPTQQTSVWENGRIYTYTRVHADNAVAGDLATGGEAWVRTMGGIVGHVGQTVDGEPVLTIGRPTLLFLQAGQTGAMEVTARAQGQFPVTIDETPGHDRAPRLIRSSAVGALLPPKTAVAAPVAAPVLAQDVLHNRRLDDGLREIAGAWKRLHAEK